MKIWPIFILTVGLLTCIGASIAAQERTSIMKNWDTLRCNPFVMFGSPYLKPDDDPRSASEFASDNFRYCAKELAQTTMALALAPFTALFNQHLSIGALVSQILESIFWLLKKLYEAFLSFIEPFLKKFQAIAYQAGIATKHLQTAFQRINAIMVSFIFVGLSAFQGMQNFIDTVINIILIICGIMLAIIIILFFILFPFIPLIITVLTVISAVVVGSAASTAADMKGGFCFAPETPVRLKTGATKPISELQVGDELDSAGGTVEGVLMFDGTDTPLYTLNGIRVSGSHLVQDEQGGWRSVASDPRAVPIQERVPLLYCLNTTRRIIPVVGSQGPVQFRDWEEMEEEDEEGQRGWDELVRSMLGMDQEATESSNHQGTFCLMSPAIRIRRQDGSCVRLEGVRIGDFVEDGKGGFTRVLGLVEGQVQGSSVARDSIWMSACIRKSEDKWARVTTLGSGSDTQVGRHLITESGMFQTEQGLVRDFTEVGYDRIQETYPFVADRLSNYSREQKINNRYIQKKS
jgi:hypothetical protein